MALDRARVFGAVADEYDRIRPVYPDRLLDDAIAYAGLQAGEPVLDVGAGTGKATLALAARGYPVTALEPDAAMADVLRGRAPVGVEIQVASFEDFTSSTTFGLVTAAQSWHWTDPSTRYARAASLLRPDGALAMFWNRERLADPGLVAAALAVHAEVAPGVQFTLQDRSGMFDSTAANAEVTYDGHFGPVEERNYPWSRRLSRADTLALLTTHSEYRVVDRAVLDRLLARLAEVLPDDVELSMDTLLVLTRRS